MKFYDVLTTEIAPSIKRGRWSHIYADKQRKGYRYSITDCTIDEDDVQNIRESACVVDVKYYIRRRALVIKLSDKPDNIYLDEDEEIQGKG